MREGGFDFAVCGSTPFARLLAGILAADHGKRVCLVGDRWSPYRLVRRFDISVAPFTRPETWALLRQEVPEALKRLAAIGRSLYERVDPLFVAETEDSIARLGHMRWTALGFGFAAERAVDRSITAEGSICRIRDAAMLVPARAEPALEAWLEKAGVRHLPPDSTVVLRRDGTASLSSGSETMEANTVVLADDESISDRLPQAERHRLLVMRSDTSIMIQPGAPPLGGPFVAYLDRDLWLFQRSAKAPIVAIAAGDPQSAPARVAASIPAKEPLRRNGQCVFRAATIIDGAPLVGRMGKSRVIVVAGLGAPAAFLAPALARYLNGTASEDGRLYFESREPSRAASRAAVAEAAPEIAIEAAS